MHGIIQKKERMIMKKIIAVLSISLMASVASAVEFDPQLFDVPSVDAIMADTVVLNEETVPAEMVAKRLYLYGEVNRIQDTGAWHRYDTLKELESALESQVSLHIASFERMKTMKDPTYWLYESTKKDASIDHYLYVEDQGKVQVVKFWKAIPGDEPTGPGVAFEKSENRYELPAKVKKKLDTIVRKHGGAYFGASGYNQDPKILIELNKPFASEISSTYPEVGTPGPSFSAPYLWGHYFMQYDAEIDAVYKANVERFQAPFKYEDFELSLYNNIGEFEDYIGAQVPLRGSQVRFLKQVAKDYYILHAHYTKGNLFGYDDFLHFYTVDGHKPFMSILLNRKDYYKE